MQADVLVVYGKKPRASKTSLKYSYDGVKYFLYTNKVNTSGNFLIFQDTPPYPLIQVIAISVGEDKEKAIDWIKNNAERIKIGLGDYREKIQLPFESWILILKNTKKLNRKYDIRETHKNGYRLAICEIGNDKYKYLYVLMKEAPILGSGTTRRLDVEEIYKEYLRRLEDARILQEQAGVSDS